MKTLLSLLNSKKFILIVSLPQNSIELAKAAEEGGADAIKVHINVKHEASGTKFGSWNEEKNNLKKILSAIKIPVGIMPGAEICATQKEMEEIENLGFDFIDIYDFHLPPWMLSFKKIIKIVAIGHNFSLEAVKVLNTMNIDLIEASIIPPEGYGKKITVSDIVNYKMIVAATEKPVIVPTQRIISPSDIPLLIDIGIKGLMIGAVVTGSTPEKIKYITKKFKNELTKTVQSRW